MGAIWTPGGKLVPLHPHLPTIERYRITLIVERLPEQVVPAWTFLRVQPCMLVSFKNRSSLWLWAGAATIAVGVCLAATALLFKPTPNARVLRMTLAPLIGSPALPARRAHLLVPTEPLAEPIEHEKGAAPLMAVPGIGLAGVPANSNNQNYLQVEDLPPARSAIARALQSGVAESWSDREVSGYAVAGPVQLATNRVCRIVAVWAEAGNSVGTTTSQLYCKSQAGGWTRDHQVRSDAPKVGDRDPAAQLPPPSIVLSGTPPDMAPSSPPPD